MGLTGSTLDAGWERERGNGSAVRENEEGEVTEEENCQNIIENYDCVGNLKGSYCPANHFVRIIFSNLRSEKALGLRPPRGSGKHFYIDDTEWRSPYAKARYRDTLVLESAGDLPNANKFYANSLRRLALSSQADIWRRHRQRSLLFASLQRTLLRLRAFSMVGQRAEPSGRSRARPSPNRRPAAAPRGATKYSAADLIRFTAKHSKVLGAGSFGVVYKGRPCTATGCPRRSICRGLMNLE